MIITPAQSFSFCQLGQRKRQEDARFPDTDCPESIPAVFVVCDGVGGMEDGSAASRCVAESLGSFMGDIAAECKVCPDDLVRALRGAVKRLDGTVTQKGHDMGTTLACVCFSCEGALCAHIGDSRVYHIRPGVGILYRSEDHSLVNALIKEGLITPEEAEHHPQRNVITRCLGAVEGRLQRPNATFFRTADVSDGDYFFICSDGVLHCVDDSTLVAILSDKEMSNAEKMHRLSEMCLNSSDNNTAWLIPIAEVTEADEQSDGRLSKTCLYEVSTETESKQSRDEDGTLTGRMAEWLDKIANIFNKHNNRYDAK